MATEIRNVRSTKPPDNIVIEVCQDLSASKDDFIVNEIHTMLQAVFRMKYQGIPVKPSSIEVDTSNIWRSVYEHGDWDISLNGLPPKKNVDKTINGLLYLYKTVRSYFLKFLKTKLKQKQLRLLFLLLVLIRIQLKQQTKR